LIELGIGAGVLVAAALSAVDQGLNHLGEAHLSAIADEGGSRAKEAARVLSAWESVHARLLVGRVVCFSAAVALAVHARVFGDGLVASLLLSFSLALTYGGLTAIAVAMLRRAAAS